MDEINTMQVEVLTEAPGLPTVLSEDAIEPSGQITITFRVEPGASPGSLLMVPVGLKNWDAGTYRQFSVEERKSFIQALQLLPEAGALRIPRAAGLLVGGKAIAGSEVTYTNNGIWTQRRRKSAEVEEPLLAPAGLIVNITNSEDGDHGC
jgi:hypothetical protein